MASVVVTLKIMPESPDVDLSVLQSSATEMIDAFVGESGQKKVENVPLAFGLQELRITFVMDESKGDTEVVENQIAGIEGVASVSVIDVRRTIG